MKKTKLKLTYIGAGLIIFCVVMILGTITEYYGITNVRLGINDMFGPGGNSSVYGSDNEMNEDLMELAANGTPTSAITNTPVPTPTPTLTPTPTPTNTPTPTYTPTPTNTPTPTDTPTPTPTDTPTPTPTDTPTPTNTPTPTPVFYETNVAIADVVSGDIDIYSSPEIINTGDSNEDNIIGKMARGSYCIILEDLGDWYKISTGSISEGYISKTDLTDGSGTFITGLEAAQRVDEDGVLYATVIAKVNYRSEPRVTGSTRLGHLDKGTKIKIYLMQSFNSRKAGESGWFYFEEVDGTRKGYVTDGTEYLRLEFDYEPGYTKDEIVKMKVENQILIAYKKQGGGVVYATDYSQEVITKYKNNGIIVKSPYEIEYTQRSEEEIKKIHSMITDEAYDTRLFATIIATESGGQPYEGMLAVANVIINRMLSTKFDGAKDADGNLIEAKNGITTVAEVVFAKNQFDGAAQNLIQKIEDKGYLDNPDSIYYKVVYDALSGLNNVGDMFYFRTETSALRMKVSSESNTLTCPLLGYTEFIVIQDHVFFNK